MKFIRAKGVGRHVKVRCQSRAVYTKRDEVLLSMGFASYRAYLNSPLWKAVREAVLATTPKCEICDGAKSKHVHHLSYSRSVLTAKARHSLVALCPSCHGRVERRLDGTKRNSEGVMKMTRKLLRKAGRWVEHTKRGSKDNQARTVSPEGENGSVAPGA